MPDLTIVGAGAITGLEATEDDVEGSGGGRVTVAVVGEGDGLLRTSVLLADLAGARPFQL